MQCQIKTLIDTWQNTARRSILSGLRFLRGVLCLDLSTHGKPSQGYLQVRRMEHLVRKQQAKLEASAL